MKQQTKRIFWKICIVAAILLAIVTFTPLVIPKEVYKPMLAGIPYTLWITFLIAVIFVVLTYIGSRVHPGRNEEEV